MPHPHLGLTLPIGGQLPVVMHQRIAFRNFTFYAPPKELQTKDRPDYLKSIQQGMSKALQPNEYPLHTLAVLS